MRTLRLLRIFLTSALALCAQNTAKFPLTVPTTAQLGVASNRAETTLTAGVNASVTSLPVTSSSGFKAGSFVTVDSEMIAVCAVPDGTHLTVGVSACPNADGRGIDTSNGGGAAASHLSAAKVQGRIVAWHQNQAAAEIIAIGTKLHNEHPSVKDCGATGDGVTDDTTAFQTCITNAQAGGAYLRVPAGTYLISSTLNITSGLVLEGASGAPGLTKIKYSGAGTAVKVYNPSPSAPAPWIYRVYLRNLSIVSTQGWGVATTGLDLHNASEFELKDIVVGGSTATGFATGIRAAVNIGVMRELVLTGNHTGVALMWMDEPLGPSSASGPMELSHSNFFQNDTAVAIYGLFDSTIHDNWFEQFHTGILIDNALSSVTGNTVHSVSVDNNGFSGYTTVTPAYSDNRALKMTNTNNATSVNVTDFRWYENSCYVNGTDVMQFVLTGSHVATLFEGDIHHNELWGGTAGAILSDVAAKTFVALHQNDSRVAFFGASAPDVDPAALINQNGFDIKYTDFQYANFRVGLKTNFASKFYASAGDPLYLLGTDKSFISFLPDSGTGLTRGTVGFPTSTGTNYSMQMVNNVSGAAIVFLTTDSGPIIARGGALETDNGYGALASGTVNPMFGGGGGSPNIGSLSFGDGTGYNFVVGTKVAGVFTPRFSFNDKGVLKFAAGANIYCGSGTPNGNGVAAPVGSIYLRTDGGAGTTLYVKETLTTDLGWVGK